MGVVVLVIMRVKTYSCGFSVYLAGFLMGMVVVCLSSSLLVAGEMPLVLLFTEVFVSLLGTLAAVVSSREDDMAVGLRGLLSLLMLSTAVFTSIVVISKVVSGVAVIGVAQGAARVHVSATIGAIFYLYIYKDKSDTAVVADME
jgi:hypothetical protein